jgi:transposase-like protein
LTTGKLNAVRAAFKAGVKPSAIARQFGISQFDVRKALAQGTRREARSGYRSSIIRPDREGEISG